MVILIGIGVVFLALLWCYAKNFKPGLALGYLLCLGLSLAVLWQDAWPHCPKSSLVLAVGLVAFPFVCFLVALVDMRWGLFATQTFYLLAIPILSCPMLVAVALGWRIYSLVSR